MTRGLRFSIALITLPSRSHKADLQTLLRALLNIRNPIFGVVNRMKRNLIVSIIVATMAVSTAVAVCVDKTSLSQLSLLDLEGKSVTPLAAEVRRLSASFASEKVKFWLVYPDADAPPDAIRRHIKEYNYNCEALRDPRHELIKATGVSVTPEAAVFVFNRSGARLIYRGRIDDQYAAFGKHRPAPAVRDLEDVLTAVVKGAAVEFKTTPAVGCYISDLK
jgi:hypothetical protein